jgi:hypothetical protein
MENEYLERLVRVEGKLDTLIEGEEKKAIEKEKNLARLAELEDWRTKLNERIAWITGAFTVVASGLGYFTKEIVDYIHHLLWSN